jgi:hypothetical protein
MRLASEQAALARGSASSYGLYNARDHFIVDLPPFVSLRDPRLHVGPLVDPILAHSSPGSKPYKQLCGLLTTMLKVNTWACSHAASSVLRDYAERSCRAVYEATSAVLASAATAASAAASSTSSKGGSAKAAASQAQT